MISKFILNSAAKYLAVIVKDEKFIKIFTAREREAIQTALESIESASHYPTIG